MKRMKKLLSALLAGVMVFGLSVPALADEPATSGNTTGTLTSEGDLPDEIVNVELPVVTEGDFNLILDPNDLIPVTIANNAARYQGTFDSASGTHAYFKTEAGSSAADDVYSGVSKTLTITNKGGKDIGVKLTATVSGGEVKEGDTVKVPARSADTVASTFELVSAANLASATGAAMTLELHSDSATMAIEDPANVFGNPTFKRAVNVKGRADIVKSVTFAAAGDLDDSTKTSVQRKAASDQFDGTILVELVTIGEKKDTYAKVTATKNGSATFVTKAANDATIPLFEEDSTNAGTYVWKTGADVITFDSNSNGTISVTLDKDAVEAEIARYKPFFNSYATEAERANAADNVSDTSKHNGIIAINTRIKDAGVNGELTTSTITCTPFEWKDEAIINYKVNALPGAFSTQWVANNSAYENVATADVAGFDTMSFWLSAKINTNERWSFVPSFPKIDLVWSVEDIDSIEIPNTAPFAKSVVKATKVDGTASFVYDLGYGTLAAADEQVPTTLKYKKSDNTAATVSLVAYDRDHKTDSYDASLKTVYVKMATDLFSGSDWELVLHDPNATDNTGDKTIAVTLK